jgi:hypothetical protein
MGAPCSAWPENQVSIQVSKQVRGQPDNHESAQLRARPWLLSATPSRRQKKPKSWKDIKMNDFGKPAPRFRKSTFSGAANANCVEVGFETSAVLMRDSKDKGGPVLRFTVGEWEAFLAGAKAGEFDLA